ncbi:MAG: GntR family transcriptional regulator [Proteobacteria bacterium]|jgi:GntR family transcriptional regulator|nr:GntR family transcriptional regulator [Pseudomonadota bacterium]MDA1290756.1 GntR family transcriptional regulator [Pseudomonadota bacterium]
MNITINTKDGVPIYRQIANQIRYMVASNLLQAGEEISPVRTLALALNVTPNTVVKAYDELQAAGVIFKRRGAGTYISDEQSPLADRERKRIIEARIDALLAEAHQLDFNAHDLLELVRDRQTQLGEKKQAKNAGSEKNDE